MARPKNPGTGKGDGAERARLTAAAPRVNDIGPRLELLVELRNDSNRTLFAIGDLRGMKYDEATRTLRVLLTDREFEASHSAGIGMLPRLLEVEPGGSTTLRVEIPKTLARLSVPAGPPQPVPEIEQISTTEAETVQVDIAWSRTPFYRDPRARTGAVSDLVTWEDGVVESRGPMASPTYQR